MGAEISMLENKERESVDMSGAQEDFVRQIIDSSKVVIFSKTYCPYCTMAKEQFRKLSVEMNIIELDKRADGDQIQDVLGQITGSRTVPRCFIDGKFIGGGTDVKQMYDQGLLQKYFS